MASIDKDLISKINSEDKSVIPVVNGYLREIAKHSSNIATPNLVIYLILSYYAIITVKQGYMLIEDHIATIGRVFDKRWFVLRNDGILSFYQIEYDKSINENADREIDCHKITKLKNKIWNKRNPKKKFCIKIWVANNDETKDYKFICTNADKRQEWMQAFEQVSDIKALK